ncbi:TIGR03089 family protein [Actinoplanes sichuanensis]|uniref:TIGR03089 family protein n=1 Tax=Actinoplanes sichuanensis TaxID=512349 RepID=A0ABW4AQR4_9ACTN|nr:TIGR03089 family protein [Actinoplanes sichuanensis]BEL07259.1 TIGR03089 family protein [Actinoplanes sichuanensis]
MITFYDDATGEQTRLTAAELGAWAAATADLLTTGCGLRRGSRAGVLLPPHWQTAAVLLGAWAAGIEVSFRGWGAAGLSPDTGPTLDVTFVERRRVGSWLEDVPPAGHRFVLGLAPDGGPTPDVPPDYRDFAPAARARLGVPPPPPGGVEAGAAATVDGTTFGEYGAAAAGIAAARGFGAGDRILVDTAACEEPLIWLMAPLTAGASIVLCANLDRSRLDARIAAEGVTGMLC